MRDVRTDLLEDVFIPFYVLSDSTLVGVDGRLWSNTVDALCMCSYCSVVFLKRHATGVDVRPLLNRSSGIDGVDYISASLAFTHEGVVLPSLEVLTPAHWISLDNLKWAYNLFNERLSLYVWSNKIIMISPSL